MSLEPMSIEDVFFMYRLAAPILSFVTYPFRAQILFLTQSIPPPMRHTSLVAALDDMMTAVTEWALDDGWEEEEEEDVANLSFLHGRESQIQSTGEFDKEVDDVVSTSFHRASNASPKGTPKSCATHKENN